VPSWAALVIGCLISAVLAYLVGRPILKLRGHYLAIATLGLGVLVALVITTESQWTGGPDGMPVAKLVLFGWRASGSYTWYWITGGLLVLGTWIALNLYDTPTGRAFRALHDSEVAARVAGIDVARFKLQAFVIAAVYASLAGSVLASDELASSARIRPASSIPWSWSPWWCSAGSARWSAASSARRCWSRCRRC